MRTVQTVNRIPMKNDWKKCTGSEFENQILYNKFCKAIFIF